MEITQFQTIDNTAMKTTKKKNVEQASNTIDNPDVVIQADLSTPEIKDYFTKAITEKYHRLKESEIAQFHSKINSFTRIGGIEKYLQRSDLDKIRNIPDLYAALHSHCLAKAESDVSLVNRLSHQGFDMQKWKGQYKELNTDARKFYEVGFKLSSLKTRPSTVLARHEFKYMETEKTPDVGTLLVSADQSRMIVITNPSDDLNEHPRNYQLISINNRDQSYKMHDLVVRFLIGFTKDGSQNFALFSSAGLELI